MSAPTAPPVPTDLPTGVSILCTLQTQLLMLQAKTPYRRARLYRIADQVEYVVLQWPLAEWPTTNCQQQLVPNHAVLLRQLATLKEYFAAFTGPANQLWEPQQQLLQLLHYLL